MKTRSHVVHVDLSCTAERAFAALVTPSSVRAWWQASRVIVVPEPGGTWAATWGADEDDPEYVLAAHILVFEPPKRLFLIDSTYRARSGPLPFEADLSTDFSIEPRGATCRLQVKQEGFPSDSVADEFYSACEIGWRTTLAALREHLSRPR